MDIDVVVLMELGHIVDEFDQFWISDVCRLSPLPLDTDDIMRVPLMVFNDYMSSRVGKSSIEVIFPHLKKEVRETPWGKKG